MTNRFFALPLLCAFGCAGLSNQLPSMAADAPSRAVAQPNQVKEADDFPLSEGPYLAAYRWGAANKDGGAGANKVFANWLQRPVVWAEDFEPSDRWDNIEGGDWQLGEWNDWKKEVAGRRLILSVPLLPGGWDLSGPQAGAGAKQAVSLEAGAKGDYNAHFQKLAQNLVRYSLADSVLRLGWEFNGGWYAWRAKDNPKAFADYWAQIVRTMRGVKGAEKLRFCWNPAMGWQQFPSTQAWPGDEFVDIVGLDVYDDSWLKDTYPWPKDATPEVIEARRKKVWDEVIWNGSYGLKSWRDFAQQHKKPFALPEWGVDKRGGGDDHGGLDNPTFIEQMHTFITDPGNKVLFHCYFDVQAPDGGHQLSSGRAGTETTLFPLSSQKFKALFDGQAKATGK